MFPRRILVAAALAIALSSGGCVFFRKKTTFVPDNRPLRIGRVALVNEAERFALIETFSGPPAEGTTLRIYRGEAVAAELRVTDVRRRPFLVADFVTGEPTKDDVVFQPVGENSQPPKAERATATPAPAPPPKRPGWWRRLFPFGKSQPALGSDASAPDQ